MLFDIHISDHADQEEHHLFEADHEEKEDASAEYIYLCILLSTFRWNDFTYFEIKE